jgi:ComF family protein
LLCHEPTPKRLPLCDDCEPILPWIKNNQTNYSHYFNKLVILFEYDFPINKLITQLKFQHQLPHANLFGKLLTSKIKQSYQNTPLPSLIIPVPLHFKRLKERGFNQALEIAKPISKKLKIPLEKTICYRKKYTEAQSALSQKERRTNLSNAFALIKNIPDKHIALVDDVITTGQTLNELAKILRENGAEKIDVWCCAQTQHIPH